MVKLVVESKVAKRKSEPKRGFVVFFAFLGGFFSVLFVLGKYSLYAKK